MVIVTPVLLASLMVFDALVVFTAWFAKLKLVGEKVTLAEAPVPVRVILWGLLVALSVTTTVPRRVPLVVGVKITLMAQ